MATTLATPADIHLGQTSAFQLGTETGLLVCHPGPLRQLTTSMGARQWPSIPREEATVIAVPGEAGPRVQEWEAAAVAECRTLTLTYPATSRTCRHRIIEGMTVRRHRVGVTTEMTAGAWWTGTGTGDVGRSITMTEPAPARRGVEAGRRRH